MLVSEAGQDKSPWSDTVCRSEGIQISNLRISWIGLVDRGTPHSLVTSHLRILCSGNAATLRMALGSAEIELGEIRNYPRFVRRIARKLSEINGLSREHGLKPNRLAKG